MQIISLLILILNVGDKIGGVKKARYAKIYVVVQILAFVLTITCSWRNVVFTTTLFAKMIGLNAVDESEKNHPLTKCVLY